MTKRISARIRKFLLGNNTATDTATGSKPHALSYPISINVCEEYANAFRTESYNEFWLRVLALSNEGLVRCISKESATAARLSSYRLFAEHLLDPDQPTVTRILASARTQPSTRSLLSEYFNQTANASFLCGLILKDIDNTRAKYRTLKNTLQSLENNQFASTSHFSENLTRLTEFTTSINPFGSSASSSAQLQVTQAGCSKLLKRLELGRDKARAKLRLINRIKHSSTIFLVALTTSITIVLTLHSLAILVAAPGLIAVSLGLPLSSRKLAKTSARLDTAAKGTYILIRDLDTISRLVARLNDELDHMREMVRFWLERGEDRLQCSGGEVARLMKKNDCSFSQQLDELEEHLYLCFMTINRARSLVAKEIMDSSQPSRAKYYVVTK